MKTNEKLEVELLRISRQVDIPVYYFKAALGFSLPDCSLTTIEQAAAAFYAAKHGSEVQLSAYRQLIRLLETATLQTKSIEGIAALWQKAPAGGLGKAEKFILQRWIQLASSLGELKEIWDRLIPYSDEANAVLIKIWDIHKSVVTDNETVAI